MTTKEIFDQHNKELLKKLIPSENRLVLEKIIKEIGICLN